MHILLLKIPNKVYFESVNTSEEMVEFIDAIEKKYGIIDYDQSIIISGVDNLLNEVLDNIENHYDLYIVGRRLDEKVYKEMLAFIVGNKKYDTLKFKYGIEFEENKNEDETEILVENNIPNIPTELQFTIEKKYQITLLMFPNSIIITMGDFSDKSAILEKSFSVKFENFDEAMSFYEALKYDTMEINSEIDETTFSIDIYIDEVLKLIKTKIQLMSWKDLENIIYFDGSRYEEFISMDTQPNIDEIKYENYDMMFTAKEVMKKLRISDQTLANWRRNELIKYKKISNRKYLYFADNIHNIFENGVDTTKINNQSNVNTLNSISQKKSADVDYKNEIIRLLTPLVYKIPEYKLKKQFFFFNFGNIGLQSSPQVMINNNYQLVDYIKKTILKDSEEEVFKYLKNIMDDGKEPRIDTSKKIQPEFSYFYLNNLILKS